MTLANNEDGSAGGPEPSAGGLEQARAGVEPVASDREPTASGLAPSASGLAPGAGGLAPGAGGLEQVTDGVEPVDLDLLAAALRADTADIDLFFEVLGGKLLEILGDRVEIERIGSRFKKDRPIGRIAVDFDPVGPRLEVTREKRGLSCHVRKMVRGIVISDTEVDVATWTATLVASLGDEATHSASTRLALQSLLT
jgi:hypothetical protein